MKKLSKTDFADYRHCRKTFWLRRRRPDAFAWPAPSATDLTRMRDGQAVERLSRTYLEDLLGPERLRAQVTFESETLVSRADFVREDADGSIDIYEVKASTSVKEGGGTDHVEDAAFQVLVAERAGRAVRRIFVVHLNKDYALQDRLDLSSLFVAADVTEKVRAVLDELAVEIDGAAAWLALADIDEAGCDCLYQGASRHCDAFAHFNPDVPEASAHRLPRISGTRLRAMESGFGLGEIDLSQLSAHQRVVCEAFRVGGTVIDRAAVGRFLSGMGFPLHFYDYETTAPAVPPAHGYRPYQALPVQFSLHRLWGDGRLEHFEWIASGHGEQLALIEALEHCVHESGSAVSWNKSFEIARNKTLAELYPAKAGFLNALNERTVDLEDPFKRDYVDWGFRGSTSIKKVLPVLCPDLAYADEGVHDGTGAADAWLRMIDSADPVERSELRRQLLAYCELDSYAMVRIHAALCATQHEAGSA